MAPSVRERFIAVWLFLGLVVFASAFWFAVQWFGESQRIARAKAPSLMGLSNEALVGELAGAQVTDCGQVLGEGTQGLAAHIVVDEGRRRIIVVCVER